MTVVEGYQAEAVGECSITGDVANGPFVRSPYMVTNTMVGKPFYIGAPTVKAFASALGLIDAERANEELDQKDAVIADHAETIEKLEEELAMHRPAAERYYIIQANLNETDIERQLAEKNARVAQLEKQLQQLNRGGRPKKTEAEPQKAAA